MCLKRVGHTLARSSSVELLADPLARGDVLYRKIMQGLVEPPKLL